ncbi:MAG: hypothetical protein E7331_06445 [Clostridiales bacterium]|nr:hypothetical protein [Clostridiales bacterium]
MGAILFFSFESKEKKQKKTAIIFIGTLFFPVASPPPHGLLCQKKRCKRKPLSPLSVLCFFPLHLRPRTVFCAKRIEAKENRYHLYRYSGFSIASPPLAFPLFTLFGWVREGAFPGEKPPPASPSSSLIRSRPLPRIPHHRKEDPS